MASFLAIYIKTNNKNKISTLEKVVNDFSLNGTREIIKKDYGRFLFYTVSKFEFALFEDRESLSFVSGHISFEKLDTILTKNTAKNFNTFINDNINPNIEMLEGAFASIHYKKNAHTLIYTNDKFGTFPFFVFENDDIIILSNEYQSLANYDAQLDKLAIAEFLTLGVTLGTKTFFKHIKNLMPASIVTTTQYNTKHHIYWKPANQHSNPNKVDDLLKEVYEMFVKINQEYCDSNVSELCLLTAGADSRLIVATLTEKQLQETIFYTSNLSFLDSLKDKDVIGAKALANKFGLNHSVNKISFYENSFNESYFDKERDLREKHLYGGWHGGEFLGGACLNASPINTKLSFEDVDKKYKSIFSWWFRFKLKSHPYKSYVHEIEKLDNNFFLFMIHQMTRSFFSNIYSGTRGHWVQPFQLMNHGFSPFWDSRLLQLLIQVPFNELENYNFYNKIFKRIRDEFTEIPSNSPLTLRDDSVIPKMDIGIEPKQKIPNTHHSAYLKQLSNIHIWERRMYNKKNLKKILENEFDSTTKQWLDFEIWYSKYIK